MIIYLLKKKNKLGAAYHYAMLHVKLPGHPATWQKFRKLSETYFIVITRLIPLQNAFTSKNNAQRARFQGNL